MDYVLDVCDQHLGGHGSMGNLFVLGSSRFAIYLIGWDMLFDGGIVLTCAERKIERPAG